MWVYWCETGRVNRGLMGGEGHGKVCRSSGSGDDEYAVYDF